MRWTREVRPEPMVDFSDLLQDPNPIHLDEKAARGRVINQGPVNAGYVIAMLRAAYPDARIVRLRLRFLAPVRGGDTVTAGGDVSDEDGADLHCRVWLDIDGGPRAVEGSATLRRT
jgi:3-hydroxybutyryl-CoA dehydratase